MMMVGADVLQALHEDSRCRILGFAGTARQDSAAVLKVRGGGVAESLSYVI